MNVPDPRERDLVKCEDMRIHAQRAREFLGERSLDEFLNDELVQAAVIRCVEVIGEAARLVSEETRRGFPPLIVSTRHVLAHEHAAVVLDKRWLFDWPHKGDKMVMEAPSLDENV